MEDTNRILNIDTLGRQILTSFDTSITSLEASLVGDDLLKSFKAINQDTKDLITRQNSYIKELEAIPPQETVTTVTWSSADVIEEAERLGYTPSTEQILDILDKLKTFSSDTLILEELVYDEFPISL